MAPPIYLHNRGVTPPLLNTDQDSPLTPVSLSSLDDAKQLVPDESQINEAHLQQCWDQSIAKNMDLPDGYAEVHVLIIKWHDDIDELKVRPEVDELKDIFSNSFNYEVQEIELEDEGWVTQSSLELKMNQWAKLRDRENHLLIVCYEGHGVYNCESKVLEMHPYAGDDREDSPMVIWNNVERPLIQKIRADVLTIMDCCFASNLLRGPSEAGRTFEMLAASHMETTTGSGDNSFTRHLIKHLRERASELPTTFFTTFDLLQRMQKDRPKQPPALWNRISTNGRHIRLDPLKPIGDRPKRNKDLEKHERFLTLGFALKNNVFNGGHAEKLTKRLPQMFKEEGVPLTDIKFLGMRGAQPRKLRDIVMYVTANRKDLSAISPGSATKRHVEDMEEIDNSIEKKAKFG